MANHAMSPATSPATFQATSHANSTTISQVTSETSSGYANRVIDFFQLKNTVDNHLGHCKTCKKGSLALIEKQIDDLSSTFEIHCTNCEEKQKTIDK